MEDALTTEEDTTSGSAPLYAVASIQSQSAMPYCVERRCVIWEFVHEKGETQTTAPERYERNSSRNFPMVEESC